VNFEFVGHKKIKIFQIDGEIDNDNNIPKIRTRYEAILIDMMRSTGYVPNLDLEPAFSLKYNEGKYDFLLSMYGVYIGKAKAKCHHGVAGNRLIPMSFTPDSK